MPEFDEFAAYVQKFTGHRGPLLPETDLVHDLGVAGLDGEELIEALRDRYGLKFAEDEVLERFGAEQAMTPWGAWLWLTGRMTPLKNLTMRELHQRVASDASKNT